MVSADARQILAVRRHTLGWVSQFLRVIPRISALEVVMQPLLEQGVERAECRDRAEALLAALNVPQRLWPLAPSTFSGGEQQRVNIARGFIARHPILLLDEPTASLDADNRQVVIELIREARVQGRCLLGIFHDAEVREAVATQTLELRPALAAAAELEQ
jgi:alpha-D-ribose 1-methylphosphonate 5-triphosphate synthase subunit PhnL